MKKLILLFIFASVPLLGQFSGGEGTEQSPYEIRTLAELEQVSFYPASHFKLMNNIDDSLRYPLCNSYIKEHYPYYFSGTFDGQGYKINLAIDPYIHLTYTGLFWHTIYAKIKNVVVDGYILPDGEYIDGAYIGGIVGFAENTEIDSCVNHINIGGRWAYVGGIVGYLSGKHCKISNCINLGTINIQETIIDDAFFSGIGGIVGHIYVSQTDAVVINCVNAGLINLTKKGYSYNVDFAVGGIAGWNSIKNDNIIKDCINTGVMMWDTTVDSNIIKGIEGINAVNYNE